MKAALVIFAAATRVATQLEQDQKVDLQDRPVSKVLNLLKDMQSQLEAEKKADTEQYEKMACWCENNRKGKTTATEIATSKITDLEHRIKALTSKANHLESSIKELSAEVASNQEALDTATAMREKEAAEFHSDETDLLQSMESLKAAMTVLKKHQAFLQMPKSFISIRTGLKKIVDNNDELLNQILNGPQRNALEEFMQAPQKYENQSSEIFGVLEQMKENFENNLSSAQKDEANAKAAFNELKAAKTEEIQTGEAQVKDKSQLLAKTQEEMEEAKEDYRDTSEALSADQAFLVDLEQRCAAADADWEVRSKTRAQEIAAVSEAITILSEDEAHDTFARTLSFLQLHHRLSGREAASRILQEQAARSHNLALTTLAVSAKLDAFTKVQKAIDDMVGMLKKEMADEVEHKDFCKSEFQKNDKETFATQNEINDLSTDIDGHAAAIDSFAVDIKQVQAEMVEARVELQRANENRVAQNKEFQTVVADQRATQVILKKALDRLNKFYGFVQVGQEPGAAAPPPPAPLPEYKANAGAGSVLTMIGNVLTDAANMEKEAISSEQQAQDAYIAFVKSTNDSLAAAANSLVNKQKEKAGTEEAKVQAEADRADAMSTAEGLHKTNGDLHMQCDYVLKNFDARQAARGQEVEALKAATAALKTA